MSYVHAGGAFTKARRTWTETQNGVAIANFVATSKSSDEDIILFDVSRKMYVRIPKAGGMSYWSYADPIQWQELYTVQLEKKT